MFLLCFFLRFVRRTRRRATLLSSLDVIDDVVAVVVVVVAAAAAAAAPTERGFGVGDGGARSTNKHKTLIFHQM